MAKRKNGSRKPNRSPQRWLYMSLYPIILIILLLGVLFGGWAAEAVKSEPQVTQVYNNRDVDDWLEILGISDVEDPGGIKEATLENIIEALGLGININDIKKGKFDKINLEELGLGDIDPSTITEEMIVSRLKELLEEQIASNILQSAEVPQNNTYPAGTEEPSGVYEDEPEDNPTDEPMETEDEPEQEEDEEDESFYYYYSVCSDSEKVIYKELYDIFLNRKSYTPVSTDDKDLVDKIYYYVLGDHPEIFWVWETSSYNYDNYLTVKGNYTYTEDEIVINQQLNEAAAQKIIDGIPAGSSEYEIVKYYYNYLVENTAYDLGAPWNQEISSVFINNTTVCAGYARAMQYLLQKVGIQAMYVKGTIKDSDGQEGGAHAWNVVRVDGKYYHMDVCWGDPNNDEVPEPDYSYFCTTTNRILTTRTIKTDISPVPECVSMDANYFVNEGLYIDNFDIDQIADSINTSKLINQGTVYLMAEDKATYNELQKYLFDDNNISSMYYGEGPRSDLWHISDPDMLTYIIYE